MNWKDIKTLCENFAEPWIELSYEVLGCPCVLIASEEFAKDPATDESLLAMALDLSADSVTFTLIQK